MSRYTLEEEEQIASVKAWWGTYGNFILIVLILVFGAIAANNAWTWWQTRQASQSVVIYEKLQQAIDKKDFPLVTQIQTTLSEEYSHSPYAQRGALLVAKAFFDQGDLDKTKHQLQWAIDHAKLDEYAATAALMLSDILIHEGKLDEANILLNKNHPGFLGLFSDRKGDVAVAKQDFQAARLAYETSLKTLQTNNPWRQVVERKIAALPSTGEQE